jgi:hypothetical protein
MTAGEIQEILSGVVASRGAAPRRIRSDNGPEFAAEAIRSYLEGLGIGDALRGAGEPVAEWIRGVVPQPVAR